MCDILSLVFRLRFGQDKKGTNISLVIFRDRACVCACFESGENRTGEKELSLSYTNIS